MRKEFSINELYDGIISQNRIILSKAITLIESSKAEHQKKAEELLQKCLPHSGKSIRIGITGVPGVGKSTFIESLGLHLIEQGKKLAVLAIDPSSQLNSGSILGDKTRMNDLSANKNAFIRPTASAGSLGGVAKATHESIILFEAAGYDTIFVETVGVGQSETTVKNMVDCFLLLLLAGAGDELQGIKRGIMEMADVLVINKADGENKQKAKLASVQIKSALHLFPPTPSGWIPKVELCSALQNENIDTVWNSIESFINTQKTKDFFENTRSNQSTYWLHEIITNKIQSNFFNNTKVSEQIATVEKEIKEGKLSPTQGANQLLNLYSS
jgi:LAO/AO transport system kinase